MATNHKMDEIVMRFCDATSRTGVRCIFESLTLVTCCIGWINFQSKEHRKLRNTEGMATIASPTNLRKAKIDQEDTRI